MEATRTLLNNTQVRKIIIGDVNAKPLLSFTLGHSYPIGEDKVTINKIQRDDNAYYITGQVLYYVWGKTNNEGDEWIWKMIEGQPVVCEFLEPK